MLKELSITYLSSSELLTTSERINVIISEALSEQPFVTRISGVMKTDIGKLQESMGKDKSSVYTGKMAGKDAERDAAFLALRDFAKANANRSDNQVSTAANVIINRIKKHGWTLYSLGYSDQTANLNLLFEDLDAPDAVSAMQVIGADSWYADLKNAQAEFENTYKEKVSSEAQEDYLRLREAFTVLGRHLNVLLDTIGLLQELDETGNIDTVVQQINEVITDVMTTARARRTRQTGDEAETPALPE